ncbi:MAG: transglutaminase-like cysteine peptidase [Colwellia sp.]
MFKKLCIILSFFIFPLWCFTLLEQLDWDKLEAKVIAHYDAKAGLRLRAWQTILADKSLQQDIDKLKKVNRFFNQLQFVNDIDLWGKNDYWATPVEFLGVNGGDCEDFSIAKYFTLLAMGVDASKLRINYVKAVKLNQFHMVVTYYETPNSMPLVLDNINGKILPASQRKDLLPIYSFNGDSLWLSKAKGQGKRVGSSDRLSSWNNLRERFNQETLNQPLYIP